MGLGIHGEPGFERTATPTASQLAATLAERTTAKMPKGDVALIVNDLGPTTLGEKKIKNGVLPRFHFCGLAPNTKKTCLECVLVGVLKKKITGDSRNS